MSAFIKFIVHAILSRIKRFFIEFKITQASNKLEDLKKENKNEVKKANKSYNDFMSKYESYVDSKESELRSIAEGMRGDSKDTEKSDR